MSIFRRIVVLLALPFVVAACELIEGVFQLGFFIGLVIAAVIVGLLVKLFRGRGKAP